MGWQELVVSYKGEASKFFAALDTDDDGLITVREWDELLSKMRQGLGEMKSLQFILGMEEAEQRQSIDALAGAGSAAVRTANSEAGSALAEAERLAAERENALRAELVGQMNQELEKQRAEASKQRSLMAARLVAAKLRGAAALSSEVATHELTVQQINAEAERTLMQANADRETDALRANKKRKDQEEARNKQHQAQLQKLDQEHKRSLSQHTAQLKSILQEGRDTVAAAEASVSEAEQVVLARESAVRAETVAQMNHVLEKQRAEATRQTSALTCKLLAAKLLGAAALSTAVARHSQEVQRVNDDSQKALESANSLREAQVQKANRQREAEVNAISAKQRATAPWFKGTAALATARENALRAEMATQTNHELEKQCAEANAARSKMAARLVAAKLRGALALSNEVASHEQETQRVNANTQLALEKANAARIAQLQRAHKAITEKNSRNHLAELQSAGLQHKEEMHRMQGQHDAGYSPTEQEVLVIENAIIRLETISLMEEEFALALKETKERLQAELSNVKKMAADKLASTIATRGAAAFDCCCQVCNGRHRRT